MAAFIHIITTRFNVPTENWAQTRAGHTALTDEWHEHRFELFQKYTFPSFKNQKNKNFVWLVFFYVNTKTKYQKLIRTLEHFVCFSRHAEDAELEAGTAGVKNKYLHSCPVI